MNIVTRFAPSPTGNLHIGGARTAIFCWLFARHFGGKFLLRIEDTDTERSLQEYTDSILASMRWLGLDWDGDLTYQRQRFPIYNEYIDTLLANGHAYWCQCSPEHVEAMREKARAEGKKPRYDGTCRHLTLGPSEGRVVRLTAPLEGTIAFDDMIKGIISVDATELDDMVLRRADGAPTYNLAVVVDDMTMNITHVLRGDDHVNNTPKQILLYKAFGAKLPVFGHMPMILGPDRQKLSKRHGAKAVIEYEKDGFLPEALMNYLVRLGWSHGDQEIFSIKELIDFFDGTHMNSAAAGFDPEKLLWVNAQHMRSENPDFLYPILVNLLQHEGLPVNNKTQILQLIPLFQPRASTLKEMASQMRPMLVSANELQYDCVAMEKAFTPEAKNHLKALRKKLSQLFNTSPPNSDMIHDCIHQYIEDNGLKFKAIGPALRVALLGLQGGPDLAAVVYLLGGNETLARLDKALTL